MLLIIANHSLLRYYGKAIPEYHVFSISLFLLGSKEPQIRPCSLPLRRTLRTGGGKGGDRFLLKDPPRLGRSNKKSFKIVMFDSQESSRVNRSRGLKKEKEGTFKNLGPVAAQCHGIAARAYSLKIFTLHT